jgi:hypothetical protein
LLQQMRSACSVDSSSFRGNYPQSRTQAKEPFRTRASVLSSFFVTRRDKIWCFFNFFYFVITLDLKLIMWLSYFLQNYCMFFRLSDFFFWGGVIKWFIDWASLCVFTSESKSFEARAFNFRFSQFNYFLQSKDRHIFDFCRMS